MEEKPSLLLLLHFPRSPDQFPTDVLTNQSLERPNSQQTPRWQLFTPDNGVTLYIVLFLYLYRPHF